MSVSLKAEKINFKFSGQNHGGSKEIFIIPPW